MARQPPDWSAVAGTRRTETICVWSEALCGAHCLLVACAGRAFLRWEKAVVALPVAVMRPDFGRGHGAVTTGCTRAVAV